MSRFFQQTVAPMVYTVGVFCIFVGWKPLKKIKDKQFCLLCAKDDDRLEEATCMVYSFVHERFIPVCCSCCQIKLMAVYNYVSLPISIN